MKNHFHLCIQVKNVKSFELENKASKKFSNLFNAYTKTINRHYKRTGSLFKTPFKRKKLTSDFYITQLIYYIHANPQKHGFINDFRKYPYSSYNDIANDINRVVNCNKIIEWFGRKEFFINYHMSYKEEIIKLSSFD
jgi:putative transposase